MRQLRNIVRKILQENNETKMYIDKLNSMLEEYIEQEKAHDYDASFEMDNSLYNQVMELAASLGLEEHPDLKIWGAVNEDGEVLLNMVTEEEALSLTEDAGIPIKTDGERYNTFYMYYDV